MKYKYLILPVIVYYNGFMRKKTFGDDFYKKGEDDFL